MIDLGGPAGSQALAINDAGQAVGFSIFDGCDYATEWSGGSAIDLGGLPGYEDSYAYGINEAGQVVGEADFYAPSRRPGR